jgi:molecular chaperone GrpE (heat shock protein)
MTDEEVLDWTKYNLNHPESIKNIQAQFKKLAHELVSKEQECEEMKKHFEKEKEEMVISSNKLATKVADQLDELSSLRAENEKLKELLSETEAVQDKTALILKTQSIESLRKRCEDLEAALKGIIEDVDKQSMVTWVSGKIDTAKKLLSQ